MTSEIVSNQTEKKESTSATIMSSSLRWQIYLLLIIISAGTIFGRIMSVDNVADRTIQEYRQQQMPRQIMEKKRLLEKQGRTEEEIRPIIRKTIESLYHGSLKARPTLSANDRSRWLTIRALVEPESRVFRYVPIPSKGMYHTEQLRRNCSCACPQQYRSDDEETKIYQAQWVPYAIDKAMETPGWDTIDMVKHGLPDEEFDPSDPTSGYLYSSKPTLLPTVMAIPYWFLYQGFGLSLKTTPWLTVRILLVLINLIPLVLAMLAMAQIIDVGGRSDWGRLFAMGTLCFGTFLSTFAITLNNHVPAAVSITFAIYGVFQILYYRQTTWFWFLFTGFFSAFSVACELPALAIAVVLCFLLLCYFPKKTFLAAVPAGLLVVIAFFGTNYIAHHTFRPAYAQKRDHIQLAQQETKDQTDAIKKALYLVTTFDKNDWYIYRYFPAGVVRSPENARLSYWANRVGIDRGEPSRLTYLYHAMLGHHGLFSLSPIWFLAMGGLLMVTFSHYWKKELRLYASTVLGLSLLFVVFYLTRNQGDRNYGGMTCGLRWFFPLIPLWIPAMLPVLDKIDNNKYWKGLALALLFLSIMSASYPSWNPWSHPWLYNFMTDQNWIQRF